MDFGRPTPDPNSSRRILIRVAEFHTGLYCGKIIGEYLEKLIDKKHPPARALKLITYIMGAFSTVSITTLSAPFPPSDPDDKIFILCAMDGNANYLVSEDGALVNHSRATQRFILARAWTWWPPLPETLRHSL